jgi:glutamine amidotransferase
MIIVIDYGVGNPGSVLNMLKKVGATAKLSSDPGEIRDSDRLILPGVGAFDEGLHALRERNLEDVLNEQVLEIGKPILGICLGMQMLTRGSEEGRERGLGWIDAETRRFRFDGRSAGLRVPHMGWNWVKPRAIDSLFGGFSNPPRFYFVHSYHVVCEHPDDVLATCEYGGEFVCAVRSGNVFGTQFHPEKSHRFGMRLLENFLHWEAALC